MFEELAVATAFTITWRRINSESLTVHRRKAALVALTLNLRDADVLLETLTTIAAAARPGRPLQGP